MRIAQDLYQEIVEHARVEAPNECCGLIAVRDDTAVEVYQATNVEASPLRFMIDGQDLLRTLDIEQRGLDLVIYHSHTRTAPEPSQTDITYAANWPQAGWLIVGLEDRVADVRLWRIQGGQVTETELAVE
ncbi:MAG TPA: M67 family metallopeptidase [Solirubrobacteraceae bacterium]|nr:M67 family metallopeptidase [Solirubrobacteraceae bacterium]